MRRRCGSRTLLPDLAASKPVADADFRKFLRRSARAMRSHPTDVERARWWRLRNRNLGGLKFRRQRPEGPYIADFLCLEAKLIVEVDGAQQEGSIADRIRSERLKRIGLDVVRFSNEEVRADIDAVCAQILRIARMPA